MSCQYNDTQSCCHPDCSYENEIRELKKQISDEKDLRRIKRDKYRKKISVLQESLKTAENHRDHFKGRFQYEVAQRERVEAILNESHNPIFVGKVWGTMDILQRVRELVDRVRSIKITDLEGN